MGGLKLRKILESDFRSFLHAVTTWGQGESQLLSKTLITTIRQRRTRAGIMEIEFGPFL
ncbi:hypothetical protein ETAA8_05200 [Anatilimnocola aggregata]|uniref:Uncharacterized protein n=1 Tax=Anatilimnocola aggregata TaxID=2528021 RepID=A0A517Y5P4_9BACT|nr:hypothetical protein ETAA8_05200 [Anatilimnocola aggregata]